MHQMFMETSQSMYIKKRSPQWIKNVYADASLSDIGTAFDKSLVRLPGTTKILVRASKSFAYAARRATFFLAKVCTVSMEEICQGNHIFSSRQAHFIILETFAHGQLDFLVICRSLI